MLPSLSLQSCLRCPFLVLVDIFYLFILNYRSFFRCTSILHEACVRGRERNKESVVIFEVDKKTGKEEKRLKSKDKLFLYLSHLSMPLEF